MFNRDDVICQVSNDRRFTMWVGVVEQEYMDAVSSIGVDAADRDARLSRAESIRDRNNVRGVVLEEPVLHAMARLRRQIIVVSGASGTLTLTLLFSEDISISTYLPGYM